MPSELDADALTPAEQVVVRVLADAIIEDILAERLTATTVESADASAPNADHGAKVRVECR